MVEEFLNKMMFSFYLSRQESAACPLTNVKKWGTYYFWHDLRTPLYQAEIGDRSLLIYGEAVDLKSGDFGGCLVQKILENTTDLDSLIRSEWYLGGKYVIFYKDNNQYYCLPDATGSVPIYYMNHQGDCICTSHSKWLSDQFHLVPNDELLKIRKSCDISQAMPYDITEYAQILQLIPNHYLDFLTVKSNRFLNQYHKYPYMTPMEAAQETAPCIQRLMSFYLREKDCSCPITGGRDSRVVLAIMQNGSNQPVKAYTIQHNGISYDSFDLAIPRELAQANDLQYTVLEDVIVSDFEKRNLDAMLGSNCYSMRTAMIAKTVYEGTGGNPIINGDIIGQVGKCSLHRDIPESLANAGYFRCKLHNYSRASKKYLRAWLKEIQNSEEQVNTFDLFSIENRMGRWAAQENLIYNTLGQPYYNIFNSRSIIYPWTTVPRSLRKNSEIHKELIKIYNESLLTVPFERDSNILVKVSKANGICYYLFSYVKYWINYFQFHLKKGKQNK